MLLTLTVRVIVSGAALVRSSDLVRTVLVYGTCFAADCSDYKSYAFKDTWGGDDADSVKKVYEFFQTKYFLTELAPVAGAFEGLNAIKKAVPNAVFFVITSRQLEIQQNTRDWLELHFKGIFKEALFGNHWTLNADGTANVGDSGATKKSKPDMCAAIGARVLIDDSIKYARQCRGLDRVVLFGNYGHNQEGSADWGGGTFPDNVTRCGNWKDAAAAVIELAQSGGSAEKR
eukprot:gene3317-32912_t